MQLPVAWDVCEAQRLLMMAYKCGKIVTADEAEEKP